jgi:predicted amino acid racemase
MTVVENVRRSRPPRLVVDLEKIEHNTRTIDELVSGSGIRLTGVTKACCGDPRVGSAMIRGGAVSLADSRVSNLKRLKEAGIETELMLLRTPMVSEIPQVVAVADISLNTELEVLQRLADEAWRQQRLHRVILMVETGDLREGIKCEQVPAVLTEVLELREKGLVLEGLGTNLACFAGVVPTIEKVKLFEDLVIGLEEEIGVAFPTVSGGNSAHIPLFLEDEPTRFRRTDHLRVGEGILLGRETVHRTPIPGCSQSAFRLEAEIIENQVKPSLPDGRVAENAYGETPEFEDLGLHRRAILALGRQDTTLDGLTPISRDGMEPPRILGGSSDHLILHLPGPDGLKVGSVMGFELNYGALVAASTTGYVAKEYVDGEEEVKDEGEPQA